MKRICGLNRSDLKKLFLIVGLVVLFLQNQVSAQNTFDAVTPPKIVEFLADQPMTRVGRPFVVLATITNPSKVTANVKASLIVPEGFQNEGKADRQLNLLPNDTISLRWTIIGEKPLYKELLLEIAGYKAKGIIGNGKLTLLAAE